MAVLHIEHPITDFDVWRGAFDRMAGARAQAGVRAESVRRPVGEPNFVVIDLEFDTASAAQRFLSFLEREVWTSAANAPALVGRPLTRILEDAGAAMP